MSYELTFNQRPKGVINQAKPINRCKAAFNQPPCGD